jgi:hypothetical protein
LLCLQPLSAIHPEKERSDGLNIERFTRIYQKEKKKRGDQEKKSWCKKKEMGENWSAHKVWGKIIKRD